MKIQLNKAFRVQCYLGGCPSEMGGIVERARWLMKIDGQYVKLAILPNREYNLSRQIIRLRTFLIFNLQFWASTICAFLYKKVALEMRSPLAVFSGNSHPHLTEMICKNLGVSVGKSTCRKYSFPITNLGFQTTKQTSRLMRLSETLMCSSFKQLQAILTIFSWKCLLWLRLVRQLQREK